jgi:hypothetical protein
MSSLLLLRGNCSVHFPFYAFSIYAAIFRNGADSERATVWMRMLNMMEEQNKKIDQVGYGGEKGERIESKRLPRREEEAVKGE